jgi:uncharacterized protein
LDYIGPGLLGFLAGAFLYGLTYPMIFPQISKIANLGNVVLPDLLHLDPYLTVFLFTLIVLFLFYLIERAGLQRKDKLE